MHALARRLLSSTWAGPAATAHESPPPQRFHRCAAASAHYLPLATLPPRLHNRRVGADSDLHRRWPAERDVLLERHPRDRWASHGSLDVAFWLEVHRRFRHECAALEGLADDHRAQRLPPRELAIVAAPRLLGLLTDLHGHHQVEDFHYFPVFRSLSPPLAAGIDTLEHDHADLDKDGAAARKALRELNATLANGHATGDGATALLAAQQFVAAASRLCLRIRRHLNDEEDLVVPLLLEQERISA